ncbi:MAG: flagellar hook assembly protein FlgD [Aeromonas sp.]
MALPQVSTLDSARGAQRSTPSVASNSAGASSRSEPEQPTNQGIELRNEFLQLMVAQIQNQDPTNPLDGTEYVSQLAQFSMVEGVEHLKILQQQSIAMMDTQQVLQSTSLIDKEVMVPSNSLEISKETAIRGQIELAGTADLVELKVFDESGTQVASQSWGDKKPGVINYELPPLPPGKYTFEVSASLDEVSTVTKNYVASTVARVSLPGTGEIMLNVQGVGEVPLFSAVEFGSADTSDDAADQAKPEE